MRERIDVSSGGGGSGGGGGGGKGGAGGLTGSAKDEWRKGNEAFAASQFAKAIEHYSNAVLKEPSNHILFRSQSLSPACPSFPASLPPSLPSFMPSPLSCAIPSSRNIFLAPALRLSVAALDLVLALHRYLCMSQLPLFLLLPLLPQQSQRGIREPAHVGQGHCRRQRMRTPAPGLGQGLLPPWRRLRSLPLPLQLPDSPLPLPPP